MPPKGGGRGGDGRYAAIDDAYEREIAAHEAQLEARLAQLIDDRSNILTEQLATLMVARGAPQHRSPHSRRVDVESDDEVKYEDGDNPFAVPRPRRRELAVVPDTYRHWESGFKLDLPKFKGCPQPHSFWIGLRPLKKFWSYKEVPLDKRVSSVATNFRGRAAALCQQLKQTRERQGKEKIRSWEKLLKHMRASFLPIPAVTEIVVGFKVSG